VTKAVMVMVIVLIFLILTLISLAGCVENGPDIRADRSGPGDK